MKELETRRFFGTLAMREQLQDSEWSQKACAREMIEE